MAAWLADLEARGRPVQRQKDAWKALAPTFADLRPDHVTGLLCRGYMGQRRAMGRQDGTIAKELSTLRAALRWHDKATPARIEMPPETPPRERHLTREERDALVAAADTFHVRLFIELAVATAARKQAILDLTWSRVDFERGTIRLATGESRRKGRATVPINDRLRAVLEEARTVATTPWVIEWGGKKVGSIKRGFAFACRKAGLDDVTPHVLRHTAAVWMVEAGVPLDEVAQYLGHSDPRITYRVYARFSPDHLRRAADVLQ